MNEQQNLSSDDLSNNRVFARQISRELTLGELNQVVGGKGGKDRKKGGNRKPSNGLNCKRTSYPNVDIKCS